ncbi:hypothetical protein [Sphingomonas glacialis]|uniref:Uncharacterized protein n=1 Tax=Sphingomonas glacialis TaxID=658225 RepID=A0A502G0D2_9SPHN|nr:hypothetical protein [Sphingomonas glacialis]TPG54583.1 hypothetical protein EAH76_08065 [Sphingomonas glacialis]
MTLKTVSIVGSGPDAQTQRAILATLPNAYRMVDGEADVVLVSGKDGNADAALDRAARGSKTVFVTSPSFLDAAQLTRLDDPAWRVAIALAYGAASFATHLAHDEPPAILDFSATVANAGIDDLREALLAQLALSRVIMGEPAKVRTLLNSPATLVLELSAPSGLAWRLSAHRGLRNSLAIDRVARGVRHHVAIASGAHARPATVSTYTSDGSATAWPMYQDHYRSMWAALAGIGKVAPYTLAMLAHDVAALPGTRTILPKPGGSQTIASEFEATRNL